jgi:hypothetical protein
MEAAGWREEKMGVMIDDGCPHYLAGSEECWREIESSHQAKNKHLKHQLQLRSFSCPLSALPRLSRNLNPDAYDYDV